MWIRKKRIWHRPDHEVTPEPVYRSRREVVAGLGLMSILPGCGLAVRGVPLGALDDSDNPYAPWFPVDNNPAYGVSERPLTDAESATSYNNYYEFTTDKSAVYQLVGSFEIDPWSVELTGHCNNPGIYPLEDLFAAFDMEERIYRFRCVERWAMTVPWSGFPLADLVAFADPTSDCTHLKMFSENRPEQMPGVDARPNYPWAYHEGLTLAEATNELAFMAAGLYGSAIPRQNGAPLRLVTPWKYGYKSIKSIVRIEFTDSQPATFWNTLNADEYGFVSNVDPDVPHPRWSQAWEFLIPDDTKVATQKYNGYGEQVAHLYE
jgi:methionine sulfoxide reductase catalytic subunit